MKGGAVREERSPLKEAIDCDDVRKAGITGVDEKKDIKNKERRSRALRN